MFDLPADAGEIARRDLAERLVPDIKSVRNAHPDLASSRVDAPRGKRFADRVIDRAMADLHNPAQLNVLKRDGEIVCRSAEGGEQQRL